jgi:hypothetical protein
MENHSVQNQIKRRKWNWTGHTLREETGAVNKPHCIRILGDTEEEVDRKGRGEEQ